jgi:caa(3)-type oxidase subunit IV
MTGDRCANRVRGIAWLALLLAIGGFAKSRGGGFSIGPERRAARAPYVVSWLLLLLLTAASLGSAFLGLGVASPIMHFAIAATQAAMILFLLMRLRRQPKLNWLFAAAGFLWPFFLYALSMTDYASRRGWP